jgi:hypothetical protein
MVGVFLVLSRYYFFKKQKRKEIDPYFSHMVFKK